MKKGLLRYTVICLLVVVIICSAVVIVTEKTKNKDTKDDNTSKIIISEDVDKEINTELNISDNLESNETNDVSIFDNQSKTGNSDASKAPERKQSEPEKETSSVSQLSYPIHTPTQIEQQVLDCMNAERTKEGIAPLTYYGSTYVCAEKRAQETMSLWSHTRPNGKPSYTVYEDFGFVLEVRAGENLAKDFKTAEQIVAKLMTSEGHRKNIMQPEYHRVCICVLKGENGYYHMTQLFLG